MLNITTGMDEVPKVDLFLGGTPTGGQPGFQGVIDDIRIFNTQRSTKQIGEAYDDGRQ